jgi:hypothetical protein
MVFMAALLSAFPASADYYQTGAAGQKARTDKQLRIDREAGREISPYLKRRQQINDRNQRRESYGNRRVAPTQHQQQQQRK